MRTSSQSFFRSGDLDHNLLSPSNCQNVSYFRMMRLSAGASARDPLHAYDIITFLAAKGDGIDWAAGVAFAGRRSRTTRGRFSLERA